MSDPGSIPSWYGGNYGVTKIEAERAKLELDKNRLAKATDPFHAFYFMIAEHLDVTTLKKMESNINMLSGSLNVLQQFSQISENIRKDFDAGKSGDETINGQTVDPNVQIRIDVAKLVNGLVGVSVLPEDGSTLTYNQFNQAMSLVGDPRNCSVFSKDNIHLIISQLMSGFKVTASNDGLLAGKISLQTLWQEAESGTPTKAGGAELPSPQILQAYLDPISSITGLIKGMSGEETINLNYEIKRYFGVVSELKSMFGYYFKELQKPVQKSQSAGS